MGKHRWAGSSALLKAGVASTRAQRTSTVTAGALEVEKCPQGPIQRDAITLYQRAEPCHMHQAVQSLKDVQCFPFLQNFGVRHNLRLEMCVQCQPNTVLQSSTSSTRGIIQQPGFRRPVWKDN